MEINTNIKIAVAGCGSAGRNNIREFLNLDDLEIVACCDTEETVARYTAQEFGIPSYYTATEQMLDNETVDALVIALPDGEHLRAAAEAMGRGAHVFCENPLASSYAEAVEMTRAARETGLVAVVNSEVSDMPVVRAALEYIGSGALGRIKYIEASHMQNRLERAVFDDPYEEKRLLWRLSSLTGSAGAIGELGSDLFDLAVKICGEPSGVSATIKNIGGFGDIEEYQEMDLSAGDTFVCQLDFSGGLAGVLRGSWTAGGPHRQITLSVYGEAAALMLDTVRSETEFMIYSADGGAAVPAGGQPSGGIREDFISAVRGEGVVSSGFDKALQLQYYIEQSRLSAEGGLRMQFDGDADSGDYL